MVRQNVSFRDPSGVLIEIEGRIYRALYEDGKTLLEKTLTNPTVTELVANGCFPTSKIVDKSDWKSLGFDPTTLSPRQDQQIHAVIEHERIPWQSYPYEWSPSMLIAAGELTLEIANSLISEGLGLKDGTPFNVLFNGPRPVFVDMASIENRDPQSPVWLADAQFIRTFILPLYARKNAGRSLKSCFLESREGLSPDFLYRSTKFLSRLSREGFFLVTLPSLLERNGEKSNPHSKTWNYSREKSDFILSNLFDRRRRSLTRMTDSEKNKSQWQSYMTTSSYSDGDLNTKTMFIKNVLQDVKPHTVADLGCNTGHFSTIAAKFGAAVLATDLDEKCVDVTWKNAQQNNLNILPLVIDLTNPSPATGWDNSECPSFLDRFTQEFDLILMLALVHHLMVTGGVPLAKILEMAAKISRGSLVIECVLPEDEMFIRIARGRAGLYTYLTRSYFENELRQLFEIANSCELMDGKRILYLCHGKKRNA